MLCKNTLRHQRFTWDCSLSTSAAQGFVNGFGIAAKNGVSDCEDPSRYKAASACGLTPVWPEVGRRSRMQTKNSVPLLHTAPTYSSTLHSHLSPSFPSLSPLGLSGLYFSKGQLLGHLGRVKIMSICCARVW